MNEDMREKVVRGLESLHKRLLDASVHDRIATLDANMVSDALDLLKAQEPRVLMLEELRRMPPVWASNTPPYLWLDINMDCINVVSHWVAWSDVKEMIYGVYQKFNPDNYGTTWRCWTGKPTEEQISNVTHFANGK